MGKIGLTLGMLEDLAGSSAREFRVELGLFWRDRG